MPETSQTTNLSPSRTATQWWGYSRKCPRHEQFQKERVTVH